MSGKAIVERKVLSNGEIKIIKTQLSNIDRIKTTMERLQQKLAETGRTEEADDLEKIMDSIDDFLFHISVEMDSETF